MFIPCNRERRLCRKEDKGNLLRLYNDDDDDNELHSFLLFVSTIFLNYDI